MTLVNATSQIPHLTSVLSMGLTLFIGTLFVYFGLLIKLVFKKHSEHFAGKRLSRSNDKCQSSVSLDPPNVRSWKSYRQSQPQTNLLQQNCQNLHPDLFTPAPTASSKTNVWNGNNTKVNHNTSSSSSPDVAKELDMDHIYLNFFQLLWAFTFVGPFSYLLWKKATILLKLRKFLVEKGILKKQPLDVEAVVAKIVLEQTQVIHYVGKAEQEQADDDKDNNKNDVGVFFFPDFPYVDNKGTFQIARYLSVNINLTTKRFVSGKLDDESLNASEALILLWYNTITAQHVKVHALGNWGVNLDKDMKNVNPFLEQNSLVSVVYNYFGFTSFPSFMEEWKQEGLLSKDWDPQALTQTFVHGVKQNVCQHTHVTELMAHSELVNFVTKTRSIFHREFAKYKHLFPGVHPEGLFAGTVLHSLDHELMERNLVDPLWLDVDDARFGKMAELGRVVRVGFVPEVPGYYFHRHFRGSGHPFYEAVYAKAAKINKDLADHMETCICR